MATIDDVITERPDYDGGGIVNLMASIVAASGGEPRYATLDDLDPSAAADARHIVLVVVDGLGFEYLQASEAGHALRRDLQAGMTSVYPPTTATAITTFLTGLAPQQHGLTGWFMYFRELGSVVSVLPFATRLGGLSLSSVGVSAEQLLGHTSVFEEIERAGYCVSPRDIADSPFNRAHTRNAVQRRYGSLGEFVETIATTVREANAPSYTYAYWPELDRLAHGNGIASGAVETHLAELDVAYERLLAALSGTDTLLLLTADHGFIDVAPGHVVDVGRHGPIAERLQVPLCGEPRTAYCYVRAEEGQRFADYVGERLGDSAVCIESRALLEGGLFGPGPANARLLERIGRYTLLMREGWAITDALPGERRFTPLGMHGGGTTAELRVPLVVASC